MLWAAADAVRGAAQEHKAVARLRTRWQPEARAELGDQARWNAATRAGAELDREDALRLASGAEMPRPTREPASASRDDRI
jgi:hypothetical protein